MIRGINHITHSISHVERSFRFYVETLGLEPVARWERGAYLLAGQTWLALSLDEHTRDGPLAEYSHLAFDVHRDEFQALAKRLGAAGAVKFKANTSPGDSLYFLDPDGHKLEIHASNLEARVAAMAADRWNGLTLTVACERANGAYVRVPIRCGSRANRKPRWSWPESLEGPTLTRSSPRCCKRSRPATWQLVTDGWGSMVRQ